MPQIKKDFSAGKMNKDLDERIVPNGQYRDAMNIQVRTTASDGGEGNAGTVQNLQGNKAIQESIHYEIVYGTATERQYQTTFIGSIANEKDNKAYFFISSPNVNRIIADVSDEYNQQGLVSKKTLIDYIVRVDTGSSSQQPVCEPIVVDKYAIFDKKDSVTSATGSSGAEWRQLDVTNDIIGDLRVGMVMQAYDYEGNKLIKSTYVNAVENSQTEDIQNYTDFGAEIQKIEGNTIWFYTTLDNVSWNDVTWFSFIAPRVLNFDANSIITGINIIDNLLFWTQNTSYGEPDEPKRINIDKCKAGTQGYNNHTKIRLEDPYDSDILENPYPNQEQALSTAVTSDLKKEHITVIRKAPVMAPVIEMSESDRLGEVEVSSVTFNFANYDDSQENIPQGTLFQIPTEEDLAGTGPNDPNIFEDIDWQVNDILRLSENIDGNTDSWLSVMIDDINWVEDFRVITFRVLTVNSPLVAVDGIVEGAGEWRMTLQRRDPLFELKFGRFGLRYKYEDGEYSNFGPWSEIAFLPGAFDYDYKKGYNLGMTNQMRNLVIKNFIPHQRVRQVDMVAVDILYKTTESPNVYVVKTIHRGRDAEWDNFVINDQNPSLAFGELNITSEMIHKVLPANQSLRAWDNVPRQALAQEVAANRIVYGNVVQGYDVENKPRLVQSLKSYDTAVPESPKKSMKSIRDYKIGMVFGDEFGRETPVIGATYIDQKHVGSRFSVFDGTINIPKQFSGFSNKLELQQYWGETNEDIPDSWISYVKYYIKETSNEYYNLVMDRWYPAEDGNIWLSFASADRNKVDEDTYLILKNEHGTENAVAEAARYKIIAIKGEAPDFLKIQERDMGQITLGSFNAGGESSWTDDMYANYMWNVVDPLNLTPDLLMGQTEIAISPNKWNGFLDGYESQGDLYIRLKAATGTDTVGAVCPWRLVTYNFKIEESLDDSEIGMGLLRWDKPFDAGIMFDQLSDANGGTPLSSITWYLEFKEQVMKSEPQFEGKFFVKIEKDDILAKKVLGMSDASQFWTIDQSYAIAYIDNQEYNPGEIWREGANPGIQNRGSYKWLNQAGYKLAGSGATFVQDLKTYGNTQDFTYTSPDDGSEVTVSLPLGANSVQVSGNPNFGNVTDVDAGGFFQDNGGWGGWQNGETTNPGPGIEGGSDWLNWQQCGNSDIQGCHPYDAEFLALGCVHSEAQTYVDYGASPGVPDEFGGTVDVQDNVMNRTLITTKYWRWFADWASADPVGGTEGEHGAKIFIDGMRTRRTYFNYGGSDQDFDEEGWSGSYYKNTALDEGILTGSVSTGDPFDFGATTDGEFGRIAFSILGQFWPNAQDDPAYGFVEKMQTQGTRFRFSGDPNNNTYRIVSKLGTTTCKMKIKNWSQLHGNLKDRYDEYAGEQATAVDGTEFDWEVAPNWLNWPYGKNGPHDEAPGARFNNSPWYEEGSNSVTKCKRYDCYAGVSWTNRNPRHQKGVKHDDFREEPLNPSSFDSWVNSNITAYTADADLGTYSPGYVDEFGDLANDWNTDGYADGFNKFVRAGGIVPYGDSGSSDNTASGQTSYPTNNNVDDSYRDGYTKETPPPENTNFVCVPCGEQPSVGGYAEGDGQLYKGNAYEFNGWDFALFPFEYKAQQGEEDKPLYGGNCDRTSIRVEFRRIDPDTGEFIDNGTRGLDPTEWDPRSHICHDGREAMGLDILELTTVAGDIYIPPANAAIWETEPKEDVGLDIYYEASNAIPMKLTSENTPNFAPYNSPITAKQFLYGGYRDFVIEDNPESIPSMIGDLGPLLGRNHRLYYIGYTKSHSIVGIQRQKRVSTSTGVFSADSGGGTVTQAAWGTAYTMCTDSQLVGKYLVFHHQDGTKTMSKVIAKMKPKASDGTDLAATNVTETIGGSNTIVGFNYPALSYVEEHLFEETNNNTGFFKIDSNVWKYPIELGWHNCYAFGNGVESDRIRDDFNANTIDNGIKASATILDYGKEVLGSRMIYSGLYNSTSSTNNLNEFNMAEKITKDINPSYGTIQRLKTRDTDMVILAEDKVLRTVTNKDALYNADGNPQLIASNRVLGTAVPYSGDFGISNNPESLSWDQFRLYFTDMQRGAVLRLSRDGLTPISNVGMKTWFRDNLRKSKIALGTFDAINGEYNLTLEYNGNNNKPTTVSFNEESKGWVSFKSFIPQTGVSIGGKYITAVSDKIGHTINDVVVERKGIFTHYTDIMASGDVANSNVYYAPTSYFSNNNWRHYHADSSLTVMFNEMPDVIKGYRTVNYEGSQAKINQNFQDNEYYNLDRKAGWWVDNIKTDMSDQGDAINFKNKEGKWFQHISGGKRTILNSNDLNEFSVQGLGLMQDTTQSDPETIDITIVNGDDDE